MSSSIKRKGKSASHARYNKKRQNFFENNSTAFKLLTLVPLACVLAIVPLIVRAYYYDTGLEYYDFYPTSGEQVDFFLHGKMVAFIFFSAILACLIIIRLVVEKKAIKFSKIYIPLGVYGLLALLSSIFSKYQPFPWTGIYEQFESVFALLGYVVVAYYAFLFVNDKKDILFLITALAVSTFFIILIGISQAFFTDFFNTEAGYYYLMPSKLREAFPKENLKFEFEKGRVYLTLYNPNYVGSYVSLLSPLFLMMIFASKHIVTKIAYGIMYIGLIWSLLGSKSKAGFIGIILSLFLLLLLFAQKKLRFWIPVGAVAVVSILAFTFYQKKTGDDLFARLKTAFEATKFETTYSLTNIETNDADVVMTWNGNNLHTIFDPETISFGFYDDEGNSIATNLDPEKYLISITDERFSGIQAEPVYLSDELLGFRICAGYWFMFARQNDTYVYYSPFLKPMKMQHGEASEWLSKHARLASGRGFIWSRTLPLLKHNIILGSGADTFSIEFPGADFLAKYNGGYFEQIITKPHNMYMQIGVQTGVLSLIALLAFYMMYLVTCVVTSLKLKKHNFYSYVSGGIAAGSFGYMVTQIINDSSITVAPIYWTLLGLGLSACFLAKKEDAINITEPVLKSKA